MWRALGNLPGETHLGELSSLPDDAGQAAVWGYSRGNPGWDSGNTGQDNLAQES